MSVSAEPAHSATAVFDALFQRGDFTLASGAKSGWKIECDALTAEDWAALALMLAEQLPPFSVVFGVPRGGVPLARALSDYSDPASMDYLVVDDVWTTGGSMQRFIDAEVRPLTPRPLMRAVVFARNPVPDGVTALFTMAHCAAHADAPNRPIGPESLPTGGRARTVEVSDRTGRTDLDLP